MTQHEGRHDNDAVRPIREEIKNRSDALRDGTITKEKAKEELLEFIQKERQKLDSGETSLNSVGRKK